MEKNPRSYYTIRFSDCDPFGHLNNARYIDYLLNAREDHLREHYDMDLKELHAKGMSWVVGSHEILYRRPAVYNEKVCISSSVINVTMESILVEMAMTDESGGQLKSICWTHFIPVNSKTGRRENHSSEFLAFAEAIQDAAVDPRQGLRTREKTFALITG
jgi:YbgC/YbaW family acyl-CoA thioester hydrolase